MELAMNETYPVKVSVSVLAYKHGPYLKKALDTILMQKVNFNYEIIVGDDCSDDETESILIEYQKRYPNILRYYINEKNMGVTGNGHKLKMMCKGEYLCNAEGDNFWIDEYKLQKQVDFLDKHPEYSAVGSNYCRVDPMGENPVIAMLPWQLNKKYQMRDLKRYGLIIPWDTIMMRNVIPYADEKYKKYKFKEPTMGDVFAFPILYANGYIYALEDITYAHRDGAMVASSYMANQKTKAIEYTYLYHRIVDNVSQFLDGKYCLNGMKANRTANTIQKYYLNRGSIASSDFKHMMKSLPLSLRCRSYIRAIIQLLRHQLHKYYKKFSKKYKRQTIDIQNKIRNLP